MDSPNVEDLIKGKGKDKDKGNGKGKGKGKGKGRAGTSCPTRCPTCPSGS